MEAKQKANELLQKFNFHYDKENEQFIFFQTVEESQRCALIVIEELRNFHDRLFYASKDSLFSKYLDDIKKEIQNI